MPPQFSCPLSLDLDGALCNPEEYMELVALQRKRDALFSPQQCIQDYEKARLYGACVIGQYQAHHGTMVDVESVYDHLVEQRVLTVDEAIQFKEEQWSTDQCLAKFKEHANIIWSDCAKMLNPNH